MDSSNEVFTVVVEIPKGSRNKYELDDETGAIFLAEDRRPIEGSGLTT